jgi:hypothetical protein
MTAQWSTKTAVWGAAVLVIGTSVGLAALDWAVLVLHGLTYGMARVLGTSEPSPPDSNRYGWALAVGLVVDVGGTAASLWLLGLAAARQWRAGVTSLLAAAVGGAAGASALLLVLGINPLDLLPFR